METAPLKSFATWARTALIREVTARVAAVLAPASTERVEQTKPVAVLEKAVTAAGGGDKGRAAVADKVAYTWFNRIIALRFMDANGYTGIGVVSPQVGVEVGQPETLAEAKRGVIDTEVVNARTRTAVAGLLDGTRPGNDPQGEAYALLLEAYCNHWHKAMPFMFEREGDFTELLIPANLLADDSVLNRAARVLTKDVCRDVEVIGWLYQFYIAERKEQIYENFRRTKAGPDEIPAATQIFTPNWIVRYLVENSLGRLWMLNRPASRLVDRMTHYVAPADETTEFLKVSGPEELTVLDPACGSGHLLTYAFDLLYAIYEEEGYGPTDIPGLILEKNLYGLEIDPRAASLAAFALAMKARARQRTFLGRGIQPHVCVVEQIRFTPQERADLADTGLNTLVDTDSWRDFEHASVLGSLSRLRPTTPRDVVDDLEEALGRGDLRVHAVAARMRALVRQISYLNRRYRVVVANPPYLGTRHMGDELRALALRDYPATKGDLCAMFLERSLELLDQRGFAALVTSESWFFNSTFEATRQLLTAGARLRVAACIDSTAFGVVLNTVATVLEKDGAPGRATFLRVDRTAIKAGAPTRLPVPGSEVWVAPTSSFDNVPGKVVAFDMPPALLALYERGNVLGDSFLTRQGMATTDNGRFVRFWWEVDHADIERGRAAASRTNPGWVPYNKGGTPTRWWGNQLHVVRWKDSAAELRAVGAKSLNEANFFRSSVSWSNIGSGGAQFRLYPPGFVFDVAGMSAFADDETAQLNLMGYLNSEIVRRGLDVLAPTLNYQVGDVARLPIPAVAAGADAERVRELVTLTRELWAQDERSHEYAGTALMVNGSGPLRGRVADYQGWFAEQTARKQALERASDCYWSEVVASTTGVAVAPGTGYGPGSAPDAAGVVSQLVSFAVGCMFGRYSLDEPGLILAGECAALQDYLAKVPTPTFMPDADNVVPVVDGDWFEDNIVERFRQFLRAAFGEQHFEANLRFATESLGVKSLRDYFVKSFYKDHVQRYKKRPIYWLFSSPKGSFNALIYMHRYTTSTVSTVLNEYLREYQTKLRASLEHAQRSNNAKEADRLRKILTELNEYEHDVLYPLASQNIVIDLDDGVKVNYPKFGSALKRIAGLEASE